MYGNKKKCVTCAYFEITHHPKLLKDGLACCSNHNMEVEFKNEKQLKKLKCIEPTSDAENLMKDWKNIEKDFSHIMPKR